jgi:hypothetical protein
VAREVKKESKWMTVDAEKAKRQNRAMYGEIGALMVNGEAGDTTEARGLEQVFNSHGYKIEDVVRREFVAAVGRHPGLHVTEQPGPVRTGKPSHVSVDDLPLFDDSTPVRRLADQKPVVGRFGDAQVRLTIRLYGMVGADDNKMRPALRLKAELLDGNGKILGKAEANADEEHVPSAFGQQYFDKPDLFAEHIGAAARYDAGEILRKMFGKR